MTIALLPAAERLARARGMKIPDGCELGLRSVKAGFQSSHDFRWPFPGRWARAAGPFSDSSSPCPQWPGDGLCVGLSWYGMASGGTPATTLLLVTWKPADVLASSEDKLRAKRVFVVDVLTPAALLAERSDDESLNLRGADLRGADLRGANLRGANLYGADLCGADLCGADLYGADLYGADLRGADLRGADLCGADLCGADLYGADLERAIGYTA